MSSLLVQLWHASNGKSPSDVDEEWEGVGLGCCTAASATVLGCAGEGPGIVPSQAPAHRQPPRALRPDAEQPGAELRIAVRNWVAGVRPDRSIRC